MHSPIQPVVAKSSRTNLLGTRFRMSKFMRARRIAFSLLLVVAGLMLVRPCAGAPFEFEPTGSLAHAREYQTATILPNGKVLVAAGYHGEPARGTRSSDGHWTSPAAFHHAVFHTATLPPTARCSSQAERIVAQL
jgi:hypothetical protein